MFKIFSAHKDRGFFFPCFLPDHLITEFNLNLSCFGRLLDRHVPTFVGTGYFGTKQDDFNGSSCFVYCCFAGLDQGGHHHSFDGVQPVLGFIKNNRSITLKHIVGNFERIDAEFFK